jgi:DNA-directed RNA polymerase subunit RPC12/RpoP
MSDESPSNFQCPNCRAKLLLKRRTEPKKRREEALCPYCSINLPPRNGKDTLQYTLVAPPRRAVVQP